MIRCVFTSSLIFLFASSAFAYVEVLGFLPRCPEQYEKIILKSDLKSDYCKAVDKEYEIKIAEICSSPEQFGFAETDSYRLVLDAADKYQSWSIDVCGFTCDADYECHSKFNSGKENADIYCGRSGKYKGICVERD